MYPHVNSFNIHWTKFADVVKQKETNNGNKKQYLIVEGTMFRSLKFKSPALQGATPPHVPLKTIQDNVRAGTVSKLCSTGFTARAV